MTNEAFEKAVSSMRRFQQAYFEAPYKTRERQMYLVRSKVFEKVVDDELVRRERESTLFLEGTE
jgi:hypothetical protein